MRFKIGDAVWVTVMHVKELSYPTFPTRRLGLPAGTKLEGIVLGYLPVSDGVQIYLVEIPALPSSYPGGAFPAGSWSTPEYQLSPRGDSDYDGNKAGEWDLCPYKPPVKQPIAAT
jgi:hypothetical protein